MKLLNLIQISWKALLRNKLRAFLTMLGIIIGVASVISMVAIGEGSKVSIQEQISSMGSNLIRIRPEYDRRGGVRMETSNRNELTLADMQAIKDGAQNISDVSAYVSSRGQVINSSYNWPTSIEGVEPGYLNIRKLEISRGIMFSSKDVASSAKVVVLGQTVVDNLFPGGEDPVGKMIRFNKIPFMVIGVLGEKGENTWGHDQDDVVLAPYTTVQKRIMAIDNVEAIYASALSEEVAGPAAEEVKEIMRRQHRIMAGAPDDFDVRTQEELITRFSSTTEILSVLLTAIAGISLLVGGIGIMNIMYVSVTERTKEIGLRMAIGARGTDILLQFLIEAILISLTGGLFGVLLGIGASNALTAVLAWPTSITSSSIIISFLVCVVTGVFFGWYPARKAAALDPIDALRFE